MTSRSPGRPGFSFGDRPAGTVFASPWPNPYVPPTNVDQLAVEEVDEERGTD